MQGHIDKDTPPTPEDSAFEFNGNWAAFGKIALTNLLLTIVTLGIYRFWATTRERKYLWSETRFIDDRLEWTGTGLELFIGFVLVIILFFVPLFVLNFIQQALFLQGQIAAGVLISLAIFVLIFYLTGLARFRALRYRLSRTYWHGIRGGSNDPGFKYGFSYLWKTGLPMLPGLALLSYGGGTENGGLSLLGMIVLAAGALFIPWAMVSLWNERWKKMSFGPHMFNSESHHQDIFLRFLLFYLVPILLIVGIILAGFFVGVAATTGDISPAIIIFALIAFLLVFYGGLGLIAMAFYAKFYRVAIDGVSLQKLDMGFSARTKDWLMLLLGDIGVWLLAVLAISIPLAVLAGTIGLTNDFQMPQAGDASPEAYLALIVPLFVLMFIPFALVGPFIRYRHWRFFITYLQCYGEINLDELTQSETSTSKHGEGLLDAFDVGAI